MFINICELLSLVIQFPKTNTINNLVYFVYFILVSFFLRCIVNILAFCRYSTYIFARYYFIFSWYYSPRL